MLRTLMIAAVAATGVMIAGVSRVEAGGHHHHGHHGHHHGHQHGHHHHYRGGYGYGYGYGYRGPNVVIAAPPVYVAPPPVYDPYYAAPYGYAPYGQALGVRTGNFSLFLGR